MFRLVCKAFRRPPPHSVRHLAILVGPPQICNAPSASSTAVTFGDPFMEQMVANFNKTSQTLLLSQNMGFTSGDPCLDFFFHIVPDTPSSSLVQMLHYAWSHNPLTTLKLVCNLRAVRGTGKLHKEGFYAAALWLFTNHPKTLAFNVPSFAEFGYLKDLPEILYRFLEGLDVRNLPKEEWQKIKGSSKYNYNNMINKSIPTTNQTTTMQEKRISMAKKAVRRYQDDANFRLLHDQISDHFAEFLKRDIEFLKYRKLRKISLAAKWCPSLDFSFDRSTLLCESIARRIFTRESNPEYQDVEEVNYTYRIRDRLRKEILVPLRKALELPEVYMSANEWGSIEYNRVAAVTMEFHKEEFMKQDGERFREFLDDVKSGKTTIAAGALLPHQIIASLHGNVSVEELQRKRMVDDLVKKGKLEGSLAICDVSGRMFRIPMDVSVAMGLLISEMSERRDVDCQGFGMIVVNP